MSGLTGGILGDYRLIEPLGRGGMATVYRGAHVESGEQVAIKTVNAPDERVVRGIRREVRALARLRHPGIVRIVADGLHRGLPWYAMDFIEGVTLGSLCEQDAPTQADVAGAGAVGMAAVAPARRMSLDQLLTLARALCASLSYLHGEGLVHQDLKPDNVILRAEDDPVIVNFGLTSQLRGRSGRELLEVRWEWAGTAAYMAPEIIQGQPVDARADLYALGCILYEMAAGARPFSAFTVSAVLRAHVEVTPPPPSELASDVPPALDDLIMRLLEKDPHERLGHAADVGRALEQLGARSPAGPLPPARDYLYRPGFIGRRGPMEALTGGLGRARERGGSLVLIGGESGIGKTRLVNELGARAAREGFTVLEGECTGESARPLQAFLHPLQRLADCCRERGKGEVARIFGPRARVLAPYQPSLAGLPGLERHEEPPPLPAEAARLRVLGSLADTLAAAAAGGPVVVILDDLHWADRLTLEVLRYLLRQGLEGTPLLVIATYRSEEAGASLGPLLALDEAVHLRLERLEDEDVQALISDMLASRASSELGHYVAAQSEGNPFFVAEYLRAAVEVGLLHRDGSGRWVLEQGNRRRAPELRLPLPGALRELVQRRIDGLSPDAAALLRAAAVMGREMDVASLLDAGGLGEARGFDAIDELVRRHVLEDTGDERLRFTHDKLREVSYDAIDGDARPAVHRRVAEVLEAHEADDPPLDALAHHWLSAGVAHKALDALDRAGARALERCAYKSAADCYRRALDASPAGDPRRAEWERCLAEAVLGLGDFAQGQRRLLRALELEGSPVAARLPRLVAGLTGQVVRQVGQRLLPRPLLEQTRDQGALLRKTRTFQRLVETYWFENDVARMVNAGLRALNLAERAGPSPELARAYATMCLSAGSIPIHPLAEHYASLAVRTGEEVGDPSAHAYVLFLNSVYRVGAAKWARVEADLTRAAEISLQIGDSRFLGESLTVLAMAALYQGDVGRADELFADVGDSGRRFDNVQHRLWGAIGRAETHCRMGELARAGVELDQADELLGSYRHAVELVRVHGLRASLELREGDLDGAARSAARAEEHMASMTVPTAHYLLEGYAGVAEVRLAELGRALDAGRGAGAAGRERRVARRAVRALRVFATLFRIGRPRADLCLGTLHWLEGRRGEAIRAWRVAGRTAESLGMRHEAARARETRAEHGD